MNSDLYDDGGYEQAISVITAVLQRMPGWTDLVANAVAESIASELFEAGLL